MKAFILAGGMGKRLKPLTDSIPKPMIPIAGKPILQWQMEWLREWGVREFVLCIGHLREKITEYFRDGASLGVPVQYVIEMEPLGTAGALRNALPHFPDREPFFCLNGDVLTDLSPKALLHRWKQGAVIGSLALVPLPSPFGTVTTDAQDHVTAFVEKPRLKDHWINGGVYCLSPSVARYLPQNGSLEIDVFPLLAKERRLTAAKYPDSFWVSIDSPKDIEEAGKALAPRVTVR